MRKITMLFVLGLFISLSVSAQYQLPVDWETAMEDTVWTQFENAGDAPENFVIVDNPEMAGINTSSKSLQFTVLEAAQPWVGAWSTAYGEITFTQVSSTLEMMVYKDVISNVALKVEGAGLDPIEVKVPNTVTGEWELLTFDFSAGIGNTYQTLVFFPDFPDTRTAGSISYIDNIGVPTGGISVNEVKNISFSVYPNPASDLLNVYSENEIRGIDILDITGKVVLRVDNVNNLNAQVNLSGLRTGLYIVTISDVNGNVSARKLQIK